VERFASTKVTGTESSVVGNRPKLTFAPLWWPRVRGKAATGLQCKPRCRPVVGGLVEAATGPAVPPPASGLSSRCLSPRPQRGHLQRVPTTTAGAAASARPPTTGAYNNRRSGGLSEATYNGCLQQPQGRRPQRGHLQRVPTTTAGAAASARPPTTGAYNNRRGGGLSEATYNGCLQQPQGRRPQRGHLQRVPTTTAGAAASARPPTTGAYNNRRGGGLNEATYNGCLQQPQERRPQRGHLQRRRGLRVARVRTNERGCPLIVPRRLTGLEDDRRAESAYDFPAGSQAAGRVK